MIVGDIRFALRQIGRTPLFSGVIIAVITLGVGINAGLLTFLNSYAWQPAPGIAPDRRLVRLTPSAVSESGARPRAVGLSYPDMCT